MWCRRKNYSRIENNEQQQHHIDFEFKIHGRINHRLFFVVSDDRVCNLELSVSPSLLLFYSVLRWIKRRIYITERGVLKSFVFIFIDFKDLCGSFSLVLRKVIAKTLLIINSYTKASKGIHQSKMSEITSQKYHFIPVECLFRENEMTC